MKFLYILSGLVAFCLAEPNIFVSKKGLKYTAQSKWLTTFTLYEQPYRDQLTNLEELIGNLNQVIRHYENELKTNNDQRVEFFSIHGQQIQSCKKQLLYLRQQLDTTNLLLKGKTASRPKRSLLPFLGSFLSSLTGTATEEDVKLLNDKITQIEANEKQFRHIMQDSLTIVNATRARLSSFATTVDHIVTTVNNAVNELQNITSMTYSELKREEFKMKVWQQVESHVKDLGRGINLLSREIIQFNLRISDLLHHQVSLHLITPSELLQLLTEISKQLDKQLQLPFDPNTDLLSYYRYLTCDFFPVNDGIGVVIAIPLVSQADQVQLYEIISFPVPYADGKLQLIYRIDHSHVAISLDDMRIAFLDPQNFALCAQKDTISCHIMTPFRAIHSVNHSCATTLTTSNSIQDCPIMLQPNDLLLPQAIPLEVGKWFIIADKPISFTILCPNAQPSHVDLRAPPGTLKVPFGCRARSLVLAIPPTYMTASHVQFQPVTEFVNSTYTIVKQVPSAIHYISLTEPQRLTDIVHATTSIATLQQQLEDMTWYSPTGLQSFWTRHWVVIVSCIVVFAVGLIALLAYLARRRCRQEPLSSPVIPCKPRVDDNVVALYPSLRAAAQLLQTVPPYAPPAVV